MSDTPDLARMREEIVRDLSGETFCGLRVAAWRETHPEHGDKYGHKYSEHWSTPSESPDVKVERLFTETQVLSLLDRIAELEGERDDAAKALQQFHENKGWTANYIAQRLYDEKVAAEAQVSALQAQVAKGRGGLGWLYVGDDGIEWSANHPVRSGEMPDARLIRRATNRELLSALKDAWEAHGEAVRSEGLLRKRWADAADRARALQAQVDGLREVADRAVRSLRTLQDGAAIALAMVPEDGPVADFLAAIHRECVRGMLASDDVTNEDASQPPADEPTKGEG